MLGLEGEAGFSVWFADSMRTEDMFWDVPESVSPGDMMTEWIELFPTGTPPAGRTAHSAVYDPVRDRMLIFGGHGDGDDDTWALNFRAASRGRCSIHSTIE